MKELKEEDPEKYKHQFSQFIKLGIDSDSVEAMYKKAHAAIRADPTFVPTQKKVPAIKGE
jgi:large subunit ribosomal protein L5e